MKLKDKNMSKKSGKFTVSTALYIVASVVALVGVALLVDNVFLFRDTVNQYVAQGYPVATVIKQLIPAQLLPGIFEPIGIYGGIAFILLAAGMINKKVSRCLELLIKADVCDDVIKESILEQNSIGVENLEIIEQAEFIKVEKSISNG
jgi:hypothetical protein